MIIITPATGEWNISGKSRDSVNNSLAYVTYGTKRRNAYAIIEDSLNLRDTRIYDTIHDPDGSDKRVLNVKEPCWPSKSKSRYGRRSKTGYGKTRSVGPICAGSITNSTTQSGPVPTMATISAFPV